MLAQSKQAIAIKRRSPGERQLATTREPHKSLARRRSVIRRFQFVHAPRTRSEQDRAVPANSQSLEGYATMRELQQCSAIVFV